MLQMLVPECHQLQTQLSADAGKRRLRSKQSKRALSDKDLRRFELPQVVGLLRQEPGAASMLRPYQRDVSEERACQFIHSIAVWTVACAVGTNQPL